MGRPRKSLEERLLTNIVKKDGCWLWTGYLAHGGYGHVSEGGAGGRRLLVHRASYETFVGPIPDGLSIDHLCRVRHCINPQHLEAVPIRVNILRGDTRAAANSVKTHCPQGHAYDAVNTRVTPKGYRVCRACAYEATMRCYAKHRETYREANRLRMRRRYREEVA